MIRKSFVAAVVITVAVGLSVAPIILTEANATEIKLLSAGGMRPVLGDLVGEFQRITGHKVTINYATGGAVRNRIRDGEIVDVTILPWPLMDELLKHGKIAPGSTVNIAHTVVGMGVLSGTPKPDISSVDGFKRSLLAAKSIVYSDPAKGGASGIHFARVLERLGIADQMKPKTKLVSDVYTAGFVAKGEAEIAIQLANEILAVPGVEFVPLPPEFQTTDFVFSAGVSASAREPDAAQALIQFLSAPAAAPVIKAKNMEPR